MLWIGGDEMSQAATFSSVIPSSWLSSSVTRMPSLNFAPSSRSATRWWPLNRRRLPWSPVCGAGRSRTRSLSAPRSSIRAMAYKLLATAQERLGFVVRRCRQCSAG